MTDRPMIFSAPMIRALLAGTKSQTRRIVRNVGQQPSDDAVHEKNVARWPHAYLDAYCGGPRTPANPRGMTSKWCWWTRDDRPSPTFEVKAAPGDRIWVREASIDVHPLAVHADRFSIAGRAGIPGPPSVSYRRVYRADGDVLQVWRREGFPYFSLDGPADAIAEKHPSVCSSWPGKIKYQSWESPIHMPRWASRLTLKVTDVRVQRVQDINEDDAWAEGVEFMARGTTRTESEGRSLYAALWDDIHGPGSWAANPWVAAISFDVFRVNIDQLEAEAA